MGAGIMIIMKNAPVTSAIFLCELTWTPLLDEVNDGRLPIDVVASPTLVERHAPASLLPPTSATAGYPSPPKHDATSRTSEPTSEDPTSRCLLLGSCA